MTKQALQKELKEKVKAGVKPSDLKKLKRSKSDGELPKAPPSPNEQITQLQAQVKFHAETAANYLTSLSQAQARVSELEAELRNNPPKTELDQALLARHKNLKDWWQQYSKSKDLAKELTENVDYASDELIQQDRTISSLQSQLNHLQQTNHSLEKDLNLATKLAQMRKTPLPSPETHPYLKYALYTLLVIWFGYFLVKNLSYSYER